jgi:hypothetical protein
MTATRDSAHVCTKIVEAIYADRMETAQAMFRVVASAYPVRDLVMKLAEMVDPEPGVITVGEGPLVFGNPLREGFAWRCGECLAIFRRGGPDPHAGVNYKTLRGASGAARKHAAEGHTKPVPVEEVTR